MYKLALKNLTIQCVSSSETRNPFVEYALQYSLAAAHATFDKNQNELLHKLLLQGLSITILGCNDFYSYRNQIEGRGLPLTPESLATIPPFSSITLNTEDANGANCMPEVAKTGLGSSAAMTTAVVAALLHYFGVVRLSSSKDTQDRKDTEDLDMVHKIAQTAHCIAQGKVGSGFDVSSAVYGSQRYVRFSPEVISSAQVAAKVGLLSEVITDVLKGRWDHERTEFSLPPLMTLLLGEPGIGGSSTPSMVGAVKKWQKSDPHKSQDIWRRLSEANSALETQLNLLSKLAKEQWDAYKCVINSCSMLRPDKWIEQASEPSKEAIIKALLGAKDAMLGIRYHMRTMGEAAGVPIEPESQTRLLDATMNLEGVLLAGVPGAGGFDAVFAVTLGSSSTNVTKVWSSLNVLALLVTEDPCGVSLENADPLTNEITSAVSAIHIQ
ncbi:phosphomevalonate kinase, peroxisomal [Senna tora]|uniref:phosphomevalonate kinase n=1 Tax=Senna tora TaxID=362788 RepID=A0A834SSB3_9FABA|nr:phosphomevalonate kinase, peroxisomal [Senna tora]